MWLLTFQVFGNHFLSLSSKQVVRLEKRAEATAEGEHIPAGWVDRCHPSAEVFSTLDKRILKAFHSLDAGMVRMWDTLLVNTAFVSSDANSG